MLKLQKNYAVTITVITNDELYMMILEKVDTVDVKTLFKHSMLDGATYC